MIQLRGHHLFCLVGFRGMGYSEEFALNMKNIYKQIQNSPDTLIKIVDGPDCLCEKFPKDGEYHCKNYNIYDRDLIILKLLNLQVGQITTWKEIEYKIRKHVLPEVIDEICETCSWRTYGVCAEGIKNICEGKGLVKLP